MSSTISLTGDWLLNVGNRMQTLGTGNLGVYATNGVAVTAAQLGLGEIDDLIIEPAGGYVFEYVKTTGKVKAYNATATGTIAVTDGAVTVKGSQAAGPALQVTPESNAGVLGKTTATDLVIPQATFGIAATTATLTGTAGALSEVTNGVNLAGITFSFRATGR